MKNTLRASLRLSVKKEMQTQTIIGYGGQDLHFLTNYTEKYHNFGSVKKNTLFNN